MLGWGDIFIPKSMRMGAEANETRCCIDFVLNTRLVAVLGGIFVSVFMVLSLMDGLLATFGTINKNQNIIPLIEVFCFRCGVRL